MEGNPINWYPGHMAKAKRMLEENLKLIDAVVELVDARVPISTRNPDFDRLFAGKARVLLLNKSDLADPATNKRWIGYYKETYVIDDGRLNEEIDKLCEGNRYAIVEPERDSISYADYLCEFVSTATAASPLPASPQTLTTS